MTTKIAKIVTVLLVASIALPVFALSVGGYDVNIDANNGATVTGPNGFNATSGTNGQTVNGVGGLNVTNNGNGASVTGPGGLNVTRDANGNATVSAGDIKIQNSLDGGAEVQVGNLKVKSNKEGASVDAGNGIVISAGNSGVSVTLPEGSVGISATALRAMSSLQLDPTQLFNPALSKFSNLKVNATVVDGKVVYSLENADGQPILTGASSAPLLNGGTKSISFDVNNEKITINNEQVIDYTKIMDQLGSGSFIPLLGTRLADGSVQVNPDKDTAAVKFFSPDGKQTTADVNSNFNITGNKLFLNDGTNQQEVKLLPPAINTLLDSMQTSASNIALDDTNSKPVYDVAVKEPFKLLWVIPMHMTSQYTVDAQTGDVKNIDTPWYSFLGSVGNFRQNFTDAIGKLIK